MYKSLQTKQMTFWETGVGLWSTAHFVYNSDGSRGGAWGARPAYFQTKLRPKGLKKFVLETRPLPPLSQGLVTALPPLSEGLGLPLYHNIATTHLCLQSLCLPCSPCSRKMLWYFESQNLRLACGLLQRMKQNVNYPTTQCNFGFPLFNTGTLSFLLLSFFFSFFFVNVLCSVVCGTLP